MKAARATGPSTRPSASAEAALAREARRQQARQVASSRPPPPGLTALQAAAVGARTQALYQKALAALDAWLTALQLAPSSEAEWDTALSSYLEALFLDGHAANIGEKVLAAVVWRHPQLSRNAGARLAAARQSLKGWRRLQPPGGRLPVPYPVVCLLVTEFLKRGETEAALVAMLSVECYTRPSEPHLLRGRDIVPGAAGSTAATLRAVGVLLHPFELGVPSKNQEFDQSLLLDLPRQEHFAQALLRFAQKRPADAGLFALGAAGFAERLARAGAELGLEAVGVLHPYRLRHTGASFDAAGRFRTMEEIQRRGRWRDPRSLRRYEHGARLNDLLARLPVAVQRRAAAAERRLPQEWRKVCSRR